MKPHTIVFGFSKYSKRFKYKCGALLKFADNFNVLQFLETRWLLSQPDSIISQRKETHKLYGFFFSLFETSEGNLFT